MAQGSGVIDAVRVGRLEEDKDGIAQAEVLSYVLVESDCGVCLRDQGVTIETQLQTQQARRSDQDKQDKDKNCPVRLGNRPFG